MARTAKSLGAALSNGKTRNATVARKRLAAFKVRKTQFQKLRRSIGARGCATVLRTGGTAALTYGQSTMGVSNTMLLAQRRAVAAASVASGAVELELTLVMDDGSLKGEGLTPPLRRMRLRSGYGRKQSGSDGCRGRPRRNLYSKLSGHLQTEPHLGR